jgi:Flp pilus assembly pilin Flp
MLQKLSHLRKEETGATAVEYALIASLIAGVIGVAVAAIGISLVPGFTTVSNTL